MVLSAEEKEMFADEEARNPGFYKRFEKTLQEKQKDNEPLVKGVNRAEEIGDLYDFRFSVVDLRGC